MSKYLYFLAVLLFISCNSSSELSKDLNCDFHSFSNLETFTDFKKNFSIKLPKKWKTNYYYDNTISSIYSADTTLNLTETILIDASFVLNPINFDDSFINKLKKDTESMNLQEVSSKKTTLFKKPCYYTISEGKKGQYKYTVFNVFTKENTGFLHIKTEVYGDSLVDKRICKAVSLIEKIQLN